MAAYAAVASLMNNINLIMAHPRLSTSLGNKQIQSLLERAVLLLDLMEGYNYGVMSKEVEDLERRITSAAHAAEGVIESRIVDQILEGSADVWETSLRLKKKVRGMKKKVEQLKRRMACASNHARLGHRDDLHYIIVEIDAILKNAKDSKEKEGLRLGEEQHTSSRRPLMESGETVMVGFEDELIQLMDELTNQRCRRDIISIVGMGGSGKTTLAGNLYHNLLIKQYFDIRAWATVSQQCNLIEVLSQLLSCSQKSSDRIEVDELGEQLYKALSGRRYLIILDDVWSVEAWDGVRHFFPDNGNRSRVVLTTRLLNVARDCHSSSCLMVKPLDEHKSWELFCKKAFGQESCPYPELEEVGKEIARLCRGLPLSTVVIGGLLLNSPRSLHFWQNVVFNIKSVPNSKEKEESLDVLSLSYTHLHPHLKPCFLYMGVFKEDSEIRVSKIINLWIAEGFLRPKSNQNLEVVGHGYIKELIDRNLISLSRRRRNGKIGSCRIHDLLRDLCLKVGKQQQFFQETDGPIRGAERRLVCSIKSNSMCTGKHKLLRVWDEGHLQSQQELFGNVNLRYLAYQPSVDPLHVQELPRSLSFMWNLQTLVVQENLSNTIVAPIEIWTMRQLRHVKCYKIYLPHPPSRGNGSFMMDNLQTMTRAVNFKLSEQVCKIIPNIKKLFIDYGDEWEGYDDSLVECLSYLDRLHKLESLNLRMPPQQNMTLTFPISLNKLSLCGCALEWGDVSMIGSLPCLEVLELKLMFQRAGNEWSPVGGQFLRLKFLKLEWCHLCIWDADSSHFPVLEKLILVHLRYLDDIPLGIGEIPTLELIRLENCNEYAAISTLKIKEDQLDNGNDGLQIQVLMYYESDMESFKERVETQGLTVNDIQIHKLEIY